LYVFKEAFSESNERIAPTLFAARWGATGGRSTTLGLAWRSR
jgi:hypothetical protein